MTRPHISITLTGNAPDCAIAGFWFGTGVALGLTATTIIVAAAAWLTASISGVLG